MTSTRQEREPHKDKGSKLAKITFRFSSLPFLGTSVFDDLRLLFLLLPLWWYLGIEQFIWPVMLLWSFVKYLLRNEVKIAISPLAGAFGLFLVSQSFSAIFINATFRYISFIRSFSTFFSVLLLILIIENLNLTPKQRGVLVDTALISIGAAGFLGLLAEVGIWRPHIKSLISYVLPGSIKSTSYGSIIAQRFLGNKAWFSGLGDYYRLSSIFLYPTLYGSALAYMIPIAFYRFSHPSRIWTRFNSLVLIGLLMLNLVFTTGRTALISLILGGVFFLWFYSRNKHQYRMVLILIAALVLFVFVAGSILTGDLFEEVEQFIEAFLYARGEGTVTSRFSIYSLTMEDFLRRPLWGLGTERDVEGIKIPLGSHSFYLALLYRFGLIGFGIYLFIILNTWFSMGKVKEFSGPEHSVSGLVPFVKWTIIAGLLDGLFTVPLLDINTLIFFWFVVFLARSYPGREGEAAGSDINT